MSWTRPVTGKAIEMQPLERALPVPASKKKRARVIRHIRDEAAKAGQKLSWSQAASIYETNVGKQAVIWMNETYTVFVHQEPGRCGDKELPWIHLSIKRNDREPVTDWRDKQAIKNQLVGPECEAVELYPAESRLVDCANQYHLWCCPDPEWRFPLGFSSRMTGTAEEAKTWGATQRENGDQDEDDQAR